MAILGLMNTASSIEEYYILISISVKYRKRYKMPPRFLQLPSQTKSSDGHRCFQHLGSHRVAYDDDDSERFCA